MRSPGTVIVTGGRRLDRAPVEVLADRRHDLHWDCCRGVRALTFPERRPAAR